MPKPQDLSEYRHAIRKGALGPALPCHAERRRLRDIAGLSRREVAGLLEVTERALQMWETDSDPRYNGAPRRYRRLLEAFRLHDEIHEHSYSVPVGRAPMSGSI